MSWDEQNRLRIIADSDDGLSLNQYDHAGERTIRAFEAGQMVMIDGQEADDVQDEMDEMTVYVSPRITLSKDRVTKHYFLDGQRIASRISSTSAETEGIAAADLWNVIAAIEDVNGSLKNDIIDIGIEVEGISWNEEDGYFNDGNAGNNYFGRGDNSADEPDLYYYHPDHLGSSAYLTDRNGAPYQHFSYLPYGEMLAESSIDHFSDYKYNGKELDTHTGLYYYGARYYDPQASVWLSTDPLSSKFPGWSSYNYVMGNPIMLVDPDGNAPGLPGDDKKSKSNPNNSSTIHAQAVALRTSTSGYQKNRTTDTSAGQNTMTVVSDVLGLAGDSRIGKSITQFDNPFMEGKILGLSGKFVNGLNMSLSARKMSSHTSKQSQVEGAIEFTLGAVEFSPYPLAWIPGTAYSVAAFDKESTKELNEKMITAYGYNEDNFNNSIYGQSAQDAYPVLNGQTMVANPALMLYNVKQKLYNALGWKFTDSRPAEYVPAVK